MKKVIPIGAKKPSPPPSPPKLGATGEFPNGKISEDDKGEIRMLIGVSQGKVIINFGKSISWLGLDKKSAIEFAELVLKHANEIKGGGE
jgi:hypothetical protein